jgi:hypothetical protein
LQQRLLGGLGPLRILPGGFVAQGTELLGDRGALEVRLDLIVPFFLQPNADLGGIGAFAGASELEGAFERAGSRVHESHMAIVNPNA